MTIPTSSTQSTPIVSLRDISKVFRVGFLRRRVEAVKKVDFDIKQGEIFGLIGPNGAGKSTTIKMIAGLLRPTTGTISLFGTPANDIQIRSRIGFVPENPMLYEHLKATEILDFYGGIVGLNKLERRKRASELLETVGLSHALDRPISKFSKGMKQRVGIAQALINDPDFVIMDEPQSGLDPRGRREVRDLIVDLRRRGKTILFCSHILSDVQNICDRVALIDKGTVIEVGFLHELIGNDVEHYELFVRHWDQAPANILASTIREVFNLGELSRVHINGTADLDDVLYTLKQHGVKVESVQPQLQNLEDVFVRDTAK